MVKVLLSTLILMISYNAIAQDSIRIAYQQYRNSTPSKEKFYALYKTTSEYYRHGKPDSLKLFADELFQTAKRLNNDSFIAASYKLLGNYFYLQSDYVTAIKFYVDGIDTARKEPHLVELLAHLYNNIGWNYFNLGYIDEALKNFKEGERILSKNPQLKPDVYISENLAETYLLLDSLMLAQSYLNLSVNLNKIKKDPYIQAAIYIAFGKLYEAMNVDKERVENYYKQALLFSDSTKDYKHFSNAAYAYSSFLLKENAIDSAKKYANSCLTVSEKYRYKDMVVKTASLLQTIFEKQKAIDKAYYHSRLKDIYNDSINILQKSNQLFSIAIKEEIDKITEEAREEAEAEERKRNIQVFGIAICLGSAIILFLLLSYSIIINARTIIYFGTISLLITFEFINLVIHPYVEKITGHSPFFMLLILASIAAILVPAHHFFEKLIKTSLVEKNRQIRVRTARKILKEETKHLKH